jgi:hypothetical protein
MLNALATRSERATRSSARLRRDRWASRFSYCNNACAFLQVTELVDPTLQHKNRAEVLVDGPEIVVRPVAARRA